MGFPSALSAGNKTTLRTSGFWQRTFVAFNPGEVVFQAEINEDLSSTPFKTFAWTNTLQGAYTSVWAGMVCYLSDTTDFKKDYIYRGRVRLAPSATQFFIDLNASTVSTGQIVTVIRDADLFARIREIDSVDGSVSYHNLPPVTTGLPSVVVLVDSDNDGSVAWTPAQTGQAVANGATISTYAWAISGSGSSSVSSASAQNPNFTFAAGYHYLVRLTTTDTNGISNFMFVQAYAITRTLAAPVIAQAVAGNISQTLDNGYTGSIVAYTGVSNLPYRTHAAVFCVEHFGDNTSTPMNTNVLMHGRLRSESLPAEGSEEGGVLQQVTYAIEGITAYMQRLKMPNDIVRHAASPDAWGEMTYPTPYRMAVYALFAYTNLLNLCSFSAGDSQFAAWRRGGEPVSVDGGFALDMLKALLAFVDAAPNFAPDGEIRCEIDASHKVDRSALVTVMDFTTTDARSVTLDIDTSKTTSQVVGYGGSWNSTANSFVLYTASAPSIPYSDAPEPREYNRVVIKHDVSAAVAVAEIEARTGNDYAANNPKWLINALLRDSHRWLVATNYQRYTWTLAAADNTRGQAVTTDTKFQCQSVDWTINPDGTFDVSAQFVEETEFDDAQSLAHSLPVNLSGLNPVIPILSDYPAFPDDPLWGFPTDTPTQNEYQPIDPYSGYLSYSPFTPDEAAKAAQKQGTANCKPLVVNLRNSSTVQTSWSSVMGQGYTITVQGDGQLSSSASYYYDPLTTGMGSRTNLLDGSHAWGTWCDGDIYTTPCLTSTKGGAYSASGGESSGGCIEGEFVDRSSFGGAADVSQAAVYIDLGAEYDISEVHFKYAANIAGPALGDYRVRFFDDALVENTPSVEAGLAALLSYQDINLTGLTKTGVRYISICIAMEAASAADKILLDELQIVYSGAGNVRGDAFYHSYNSEAGGVASAYGASQGLRINGAAVSSIPPYDASHSYSFPFTGDGNPVTAKFADTDYSDNDNNNLYLLICTNG